MQECIMHGFKLEEKLNYKYLENILLSGWEFAVNNVSPVSSAVMTVRDFITKRSYSAHQFFQNIGLGAEMKDFTDIYYKALAKLSPITHPGVVKIFENKAVMSHFEDSFGGGTTVEDLLQHIYAHIAAHPEFAELQLTIQQDLEKLILYFLQTVLESMDPQTQYLINKLDAIKGDTEELRRLRSLDRAQDLEWQKRIEEKFTLLLPHAPLALSTGMGAVMTQEDFDDNVGPILNLLAKRHNNAAIAMLSDLKDRKWERFSPEQRYKVNFTLGQAYLQLQQNDEAVALFISLADLLPLDADALGVTAMGYALQGKSELSEHYIDKVLKISPIVPSAVVARLLNLPEDATIAQFDDVLASTDISNPMVAVNAAEWLSRQGPEQIVRALQILEQTSIPEGTLAWAEKIERMALLHAKTALLNKIKDGNYISKDTRDRLKLAEGYLSQARDFYKDSDMREVRWAVTANRGVVRYMLGDKENAESDFVVALDDGKDFIIYHHLLMLGVEKGMIHIKLIEEARQHLELNEVQEKELFFLEINGLLERKDSEAIFKLLDERLPGKGEDEACKIIFFRSLAMMVNGDVKGAFQFVLDAANQYPDIPQMAHRAAELAIQVGDEKKRMNLLRGQPSHWVIILPILFINS
ncbi:hypothetical protein WJU16_02975 [Chitinophaga pollutisoli]|uniref:Tetratricopeptide repeat protein n=1 Tax=Chitinophaga pollutisoli TaxID=3133966 RepID=A0ABZ2YQE6_9BACT